MNYLTKVEERVARWLMRRVIFSDGGHRPKFVALFKVMSEIYCQNFIEDNKPTQYFFLDELLQEAIGYTRPEPEPKVVHVFGDEVPTVKLPPYPTPKRAGPEWIRANQYSDAFEVIRHLNPNVKFETVG